MYAGSSAVVRRWLESPYELDGWRIDVANMTGRLGADDYLPDVARGVRRAVTETRSGGLVVAEHAYDARTNLRLGAWHGTMNYAGFTRPAWAWLRGDNLPSDPANGFIGLPSACPGFPVSRSSARCANSAQASRGRPRSTHGRSSTAMTRRASASSRAPANGSSSASACR